MRESGATVIRNFTLGDPGCLKMAQAAQQASCRFAKALWGLDKKKPGRSRALEVLGEDA